ncbi:MAG: hypothetical protein M3N13_03905, partial [Candidatus Eremiobacteraeota bacterium]|nr:hypothetical protein [Candidatus Eremiobacteraeota bacterium]
MKFAFALSALLAITGCGGAGSSGPTRSVSVEYQLTAATATPLTAPLAIGASTTINVLERRCTFANYDPSLPPPSGTGCGSYYVPASLTPGVLPMQNANQPCPVSVTVTGPGTVSVTRTGPG